MSRHPRLSRQHLELVPWLSNRWQATVVVALSTMTLVGLALFLGQWGFDDSYITYRYAHNLLSGQGFVYNAGQRILSTTTPFYAALLAGLGTVWPDLPVLSNVVSALALVLAAVILVAWSRARQQPAVGMIAALLLMFWPLLLTTFGMEMCLYVLSILAGLYAYDRSRLTLAAVALALAAMVRPDGVLAGVAVVIYHLLRRRTIPRRPMVLYIGLVGAWYAGLWIYFGSPIPASLAAKQHQGQMTVGIHFAPRLVKMLRGYGRQPLYWLHGILAALGIGRVATRSRHWWPLMLWTGLYFLAYTLLGVSSYFWYYAPLVPAFGILVAEGVVALLRLLAERWPRALLIGASGLLLIALLAPLAGGGISLGWRADPRMAVYREIGQWLQANTPLQASIGTLEVGAIGYYANRPMVGFAGLIQPEVAEHLTPSGAFLDSAVWAIQTYQPDYVVLQREAFGGVAESDWFQVAYAPVRDFTNEEQLWLTVYQRSQDP
jgi:hypothetical protein